jgi:hypothetical protein
MRDGVTQSDTHPYPMRERGIVMESLEWVTTLTTHGGLLNVQHLLGFERADAICSVSSDAPAVEDRANLDRVMGAPVYQVMLTWEDDH